MPVGVYVRTAEHKRKIREGLSRPEVREKLSEVQKIVQNRPEVRRKISEALTGRVFSEEWKRHIREAQNRPEVKAKISESKMGKKRAPFSEEWKSDDRVRQ